MNSNFNSPARNNVPSPVLELSTYAHTSPVRLQSLYADFSRQKHSNPTSYQANVEWWRRALEELVSSGNRVDARDRFILHANQTLLDYVRVSGVGKPLGLGAVINELKSTTPPSFIPLAQFLSSAQSVYATGSIPWRIASFVIGKPLWWALEQAGVVGGEDASSSLNRPGNKEWWGEYVLLRLVEDAAENVIVRMRDRQTTRADGLFDLDGFRTEFSGVVVGEGGSIMSERDAKVLLKYLEREKRVAVVEKEFVKFVDKDVDPEERQITTVDRGILELKSAVRKLQLQVEGIQRKMDECTKNASSELKHQRKTRALGYLRSKKQLGEVLERRLGSLQTLESTMIQVEASAGDIEIMQSYASSTATLKEILSHPSLQRGKIDETLEALAEANADAREVGDAIQIGGDVATGAGEIEEEDVEAELAALVQEIENEKGTGRLEDEGLKVPVNVPAGREDEKVSARSVEKVHA